MTSIRSLAKVGRAARRRFATGRTGRSLRRPSLRGPSLRGPSLSRAKSSRAKVFEGQVFEGQVFEGQVFEGQVLLPSHECHSEQKLRSNGAEDHLPADHPPTVMHGETRQDVQLGDPHCPRTWPRNLCLRRRVRLDWSRAQTRGHGYRSVGHASRRSRSRHQVRDRRCGATVNDQSSPQRLRTTNPLTAITSPLTSLA